MYRSVVEVGFRSSSAGERMLRRTRALGAGRPAAGVRPRKGAPRETPPVVIRSRRVGPFARPRPQASGCRGLPSGRSPVLGRGRQRTRAGTRRCGATGCGVASDGSALSRRRADAMAGSGAGCGVVRLPGCGRGRVFRAKRRLPSSGTGVSGRSPVLGRRRQRTRPRTRRCGATGYGVASGGSVLSRWRANAAAGSGAGRGSSGCRGAAEEGCFARNAACRHPEPACRAVRPSWPAADNRSQGDCTPQRRRQHQLAPKTRASP